MRYAAIIFDLDGTIIDSEKQWGMAYTSVLRQLGVNADRKDLHTRGESIKSNWQKILLENEIKTEKTIDELSAITFIEFRKLIPEITLNDGVTEFMDTLHDAGIPLALATSSDWETTSKIVNDFDLNEYFENITTEEEVVNEKPAPDIFLLSSEKLGVNPSDCLVIEDSFAGVTAGKEAGMKVIAVTDEEDEGLLEQADLVVSGFSEITLKAIDAIGID